MGEIKDEEEEEKSPNSSTPINSVKIILKTVGPSRPFYLTVPSHIKVCDLRKIVADNEHLPIENVRLISRGKALHDSRNREDVYIQLVDGESFIVAIRPKAPPKHVRGGYDDEDDDDDDDDVYRNFSFQLPESASRWKWRIFCLLHDKYHFDRNFFSQLKGLGLHHPMVMLAPVAHRWEIGPLYILATGFATIFLNLGHRQEGELSAYSIFNEDFRELPGTFNADRVDRDIRTGQL